jgi:LmbE family N-acetylglucosaminyl deacetylase
MGVATRPDDQVTAAIAVGEYLDLKIRAIEAHRSQQDARDFVKMLRQGQELEFAAREYFYLAWPESSRKETDLFNAKARP